MRILLFYIGALFVIMAITPWKTISEQGSPFVQIFSLAGIPAAASIINFVVIVAACSTLNSAIFSTGRHLYQLARESHSQKMKFLTKVSDRGIPVNSVLFSASVMLFAPILSCFKALTTRQITRNIFLRCFGFVRYLYSRLHPDNDCALSLPQIGCVFRGRLQASCL